MDVVDQNNVSFIFSRKYTPRTNLEGSVHISSIEHLIFGKVGRTKHNILRLISFGTVLKKTKLGITLILHFVATCM